MFEAKLKKKMQEYIRLSNVLKRIQPSDGGYDNIRAKQLNLERQLKKKLDPIVFKAMKNGII